MNTHINSDYRPDALIVGGGIAGLQSALDLADQDLQVLVVERQSSIGGHMIALSKVYPTLDCASCITTPKMSAVAHHPNIQILTNTEVEGIESIDGIHRVRLLQKPTYVNFDKCIGCRLCEYACDTEYPDPFEEGLGTVRAIAVPFTNAIPQKAVLDAEHCGTCGTCARVCPTDAIEFDQQPRNLTIRTDAVIIASGFQLNAMTVKPQYNARHSKNIVSPLMLERLLAPHGPYGRVLRPSDGKIPSSVAFVQCAGSRDQSIGVSYCSRVCCMYSIKQAMLLSGSLPLADITIYYMDIRAFGKGYEQFFQNAKAMGICFVRGKVARIDPVDGGDLSVHVESTEDAENPLQEHRHDLVVLAQGMIPGWKPSDSTPVACASDGFVAAPALTSPTATTAPGIFVAGTAAGPKDIVDTIAEAGAAAMQVSQYLYQKRVEQKHAEVLVG
ncbi:MAG TPA: CoB--CoM heterodisulfide reductase iron-sulfur subunit A family protein [Acidobacteriaceae bacterium]|nr:CoB--CoM heterodisulfide reductase iron-sulfur subunit A family protein [Acidobacteriaceae bacterium]